MIRGLAAVVLMSMLMVSAAWAADRSAVGKPVPPGPVKHVEIGQAYAGPTCKLGEFGTERNSFPYIIPPEDSYYMLLEPDDCATCVGADSVHLAAINFKLAYSVQCTIAVNVSVVDFNGTTCLPPCGTPCPNDVSGVIWGPESIELIGGPDLGFPQIIEYTVNLPGTVLFLDKAFLKVEFPETGRGCTAPELVYSDPFICPQCTYYNLSVIPPTDDLCAPASDPDGRWVFNADVATCDITPAIPTSWGSVKAIYRKP